MRLHRFILNLDLSADRLEITDREAANQILNVFRMQLGDRFVVCDGKGREATVEIAGKESKGSQESKGSMAKVIVSVIDRREVQTESAVKTVLHCAVLKRENFELVVQKATECGVARIVPLVTQRTVKLSVRLDRLQKIAKEAAEQSGRGVVPEIVQPMPLKDAIMQAKENGMNVLFEPGFPAFKPSKPLMPFKPLGLFIGPEGGWDDSEVEQLRAAGYDVAGLGPRILRAETAAIVAVFLATRM
jgi:16S rRNA (uracil1498-N3)-methyltransferase